MSNVWGAYGLFEYRGTGEILAPMSFINAPAEIRDEVCNGCGSAQAKFDFVPDTIWGLDIDGACMVHDWMYYEGKDVQDKKEADFRFLRNMFRLIDKGSKWLSFFRRRRALKYYEAVKMYGDEAFWASKRGN